MSFRSRLTLFFVLIVIVPMVAVTLVVFRLIADNESGKADAQVAARLDTAIRLQREAVQDADDAAQDVAQDQRLAAALRSGDRTGIRAAAQGLLERLRIERILLIAPDRHALADVGTREATFPATRDLVADGKPVAMLQVSTTTAREYADLVRRVTGLHVVVRRRDSVLAATLPDAARARLPAVRGTVQVGAGEYRAATFRVTGFRSLPATVTILYDETATAQSVTDARWLAAGILLAFFVLAVFFAVAVSRSLQQQIGGFLEAARRLGGGEFDTKVPTVGNDEFAALGEEFNTMAAQLEERLRQLREERHRVERSMRRLGEAVASNLDRDALLGIVVETAVEGVGAEGGRASARRALDGPLEERASAGQLTGLEQVLGDVEARALETGQQSQMDLRDATALAHPLRGSDDAAVVGIVSVGRHGEPFSHNDRELFGYLAGQAAVSIENVGLHETVQLQATTDGLTGLLSRRRFDEALESEVERNRRFPDQSVGLILLDIDDFKKVNDTHGHQVGDDVLREVARVLRETSREIDFPARYGGEELAVVLPGTSLEGSYEMAERVRVGIEALAVALDGDEVLKVTASFGAAAMPAAGSDPGALLNAADAALYEAKRTGKNRTVRAAGVG
jgi:diguanylate cyclase (GGDEF)-like protein